MSRAAKYWGHWKQLAGCLLLIACIAVASFRKACMRFHTERLRAVKRIWRPADSLTNEFQDCRPFGLTPPMSAPASCA